MLEIIGHILATMLLFKGIGFIVQAVARPGDNPLGFIMSLLAGVAAIAAAIYFFNVVSDQASGARRAFDDIRQQAYEPAPEAVSPY